MLWLTSNIILSIYKSLTRSHLEYCVRLWSLKRILYSLEKGRKEQQVIRRLQQLPYVHLLKWVGLSILEKRLRGDMIEAYKILHGMESTGRQRPFPIILGLKLKGERFRIDNKKYFFTHLWNSLPQDVITDSPQDSPLP